MSVFEEMRIFRQEIAKCIGLASDCFYRVYLLLLAQDWSFLQDLLCAVAGFGVSLAEAASIGFLFPFSIPNQ